MFFRPWRHVRPAPNKYPPHRGILDIVKNANAGIEAAVELIIKEDFRHKREDMLKRVLAYMSVEEAALEKLCKDCDRRVD